MALPVSANLAGQLKLRTLEASTTSSGASATAATVPFRAKYLYSVYSPSGLTVPSATGATTALNIAINGSTATADAFFTNPIISSTTTSTAPGLGAGSSIGPAPNPALYFSQGDQITTLATSGVPYSVVHILQEF